MVQHTFFFQVRLCGLSLFLAPFWWWLYNICSRSATRLQLFRKTSATHCNTLQLAATRCNTLQHAATHFFLPWPFLQPLAISCILLQFVVWFVLAASDATQRGVMQHNGSWSQLTSHGCVLYGQDTKRGNSPRLPAYLFPLAVTTCTMLTKVAISLCNKSPSGSGIVWGRLAWNLAPTYFARNRVRCSKSGQHFWQRTWPLFSLCRT